MLSIHKCDCNSKIKIHKCDYNSKISHFGPKIYLLSLTPTRLETPITLGVNYPNASTV